MRALIVYILLSFMVVPANAGTIILGIDVSSSIDDIELEIQYSAYQQGLREIGALQYSDIEVITFDTFPNRIYSGNDNFEAADHLEATPRLPSEIRGVTCLTRLFKFVYEEVLPTAKHPIVLDISGDGANNCNNASITPDMHDHYLNLLVDAGVRINGLLIMTSMINNTDERRSDTSYSEEVYSYYKYITKSNGFVVISRSMEDIIDSLYQKLNMEIAYLKNSG